LRNDRRVAWKIGNSVSFVATRSPMRCIPQAVRVAYTYSENFSLFARSRREAASLTIRTVALVEVHAGASERGPLGEPGDALFELPVQVDQKLRSWPALSSAPDRGTSETSWPPRTKVNVSSVRLRCATL